MYPTRDSEITALLDDLLGGMRGVLGARLIGLYVYGSIVSGDFDKDVSDVDMLAATSADISDAEINQLAAMHREFACRNKNWDDRIEVQYLSTAGLKTFRSMPHRMAVISPGEKLHFVEGGMDWLVNWYFVQENGVALHGPSPRTLIDPISNQEFIEAVRDNAMQWRDYVTNTRNSRPYQAYAILTMCRALYTVHNGEQVSKNKAAAWAQKQMPAWSSLIENALLWRKDWRSPADPDVTFAKTVSFVMDVSDKLVNASRLPVPDAC